jgi:O-methyltransferase involved in polyketide biosynthesis
MSLEEAIAAQARDGAEWFSVRPVHLPYLSSADCDRLLDITASMSAPGSRLATEYSVRPPVESDALGDSSNARDKQTWRSVLDVFSVGPAAGTPAAWLSARGSPAGRVASITGAGPARGPPA